MEISKEYIALAKAIDKARSIPPCQGSDPEAWFPDKNDANYGYGFNYTRQAKALCAQCPVRRECAEYAIAAIEPHGIWGGLSIEDRQDIRMGRKKLT